MKVSGQELTFSVVSGGSVEVYNCATGSADCSQCLGREDLGHRCLWSEGSSSCRLHSEHPHASDLCPAPEIKKVRPEWSAGGARGGGGAALCPWHGTGSRAALSYSPAVCAVAPPDAKDTSLVMGSDLRRAGGENTARSECPRAPGAGKSEKDS